MMVWKSTLVAILILQLITWGGGQDIDPDALLKLSFPPAKPTLSNLYAVCLHGNGRARYPASCFPSSSYAYAHRAGNAVNRLEAWFGQCCYGGVATGKGQILCCAEQAWKTSLSQFCIDEFSIMTVAHECCDVKGEDRWNCFNKQAANPSYQPLPDFNAPMIPPDRIFNWDPNTC
ncbi:extracellular matrix protein 1 [Paramisgurnus dabryanus]|uniref:extracellular matrix protein 1 n=1 Tax=Paramisgurnus dabryanus TaxID=90735 RepID=UPI0031F396AC